MLLGCRKSFELDQDHNLTYLTPISLQKMTQDRKRIMIPSRKVDSEGMFRDVFQKASPTSLVSGYRFSCETLNVLFYGDRPNGNKANYEEVFHEVFQTIPEFEDPEFLEMIL